MSGGRGYHNINAGMSNRVMSQQQYSHQTPQQQRRISMTNQQAAMPIMQQQQQQQYSTKTTAYGKTPMSSGGKHAFAQQQQSQETFATPKAQSQKKATAGPSSAGGGGGGGGSAAKQRRKVVKVNKGLRHFSMKVCEKVKEKVTTTYNEVADELVEDEMRRVEASGDRSFDQKNIRRRVYDALNVLMAMNIIAKEKKEIHWLGLPTNTPAQCANLDEEIAAKRQTIQAKEKELKDLLLLQVSLKNLVNRNGEQEEQGYIPTPNSHIQLPFIVVNTHRDTRIHCTISQDKTEYFFKFDDKFELNDHVTVLQRMGLLMGLDTGTSTEEDIEKLKQLVPVEFQQLIEDYGRGKTAVHVPEEVPVGQDEGVLDEEGEDEEEEEEDETIIEYVDMAPIQHQQHQQQQHHHQQPPQHHLHHEEIEEYSEEDTIIEEAY